MERKLSFAPHLKRVKSKPQSAKYFKRYWQNRIGADRKVILQLYRPLIRPKLDYGCSVYGSARDICRCQMLYKIRVLYFVLEHLGLDL